MYLCFQQNNAIFMKSYALSLIFILMSCFSLHAQKAEKTEFPQQKTVFRWIFPVRLGAEIPLGKNQSFYPKVGYVYRLYPFTQPVAPDPFWSFPLVYFNREHYMYDLHGSEAEMEYRYYYNMNRRIVKVRDTKRFAANYFAAALQAGSFKGWGDRPSAFQLGYSAIVRYGLQRNLFKNGFWGLSFGVGYFRYQNRFIKDSGGDLGLRVAIMVGLAK
jgi:hypothetical protein